MEEVSSIAFGGITYAPSTDRTFGTCQESRNTYNNQAQGNDFMGPTLWSADPDIFGISNPDAISYLSNLYGFYTDLGSHLDMLHHNPLCMGIAWETENVYWVFDGDDNSIVMNDFQEDHGVGYDDHGDGIIARYAIGEVKRIEDIPSHLVLDPDTGLLYIADTGNNRIAVMDITSGERGSQLQSWEGNDHYEMDNADIWTLVDGAEQNMGAPSGIALVEDTLLVTDNATGNIFAFDLDGNRIDWLATELGAGALMGIDARSLDDIWIVDAVDDRVFRLQP